jgi:drug/metabolite transporter (DMT)-like permease
LGIEICRHLLCSFRGIFLTISSIVAFTSFNYLLEKVSPEKVSTSAYVNTLIVMLLGWYILDEKISLQSIIAALTLLLGVYFINFSKNSKEA